MCWVELTYLPPDGNTEKSLTIHSDESLATAVTNGIRILPHGAKLVKINGDDN